MPRKKRINNKRILDIDIEDARLALEKSLRVLRKKDIKKAYSATERFEDKKLKVGSQVHYQKFLLYRNLTQKQLKLLLEEIEKYTEENKELYQGLSGDEKTLKIIVEVENKYKDFSLAKYDEFKSGLKMISEKDNIDIETIF